MSTGILCETLRLSFKNQLYSGCTQMISCRNFSN